MSVPAVDLHGHKGLIFPSFGEDGSYLERVSFVTREAALGEFATEGYDTEPLNLEPIFMRYVDGDEAKQLMADEQYPWIEGPSFWWECSNEHPDAVPFWKDAP